MAPKIWASCAKDAVEGLGVPLLQVFTGEQMIYGDIEPQISKLRVRHYVYIQVYT